MRLHLTRVLSIVVLLALHASEMSLCTGWSASAAERMACCQRSGADCGSVSPDDCCADRERREHFETLSSIPVSAVYRCSEPNAVARDVHGATSAASATLDRPQTYLLDSVFRI